MEQNHWSCSTDSPGLWWGPSHSTGTWHWQRDTAAHEAERKPKPDCKETNFDWYMVKVSDFARRTILEKGKRNNAVSESTVPLSPQIQSMPHSLNTTQVSLGTHPLCAPLGRFFSQTFGTVGKAQLQTDTAPHVSERNTKYWKNAVNFIQQQYYGTGSNIYELSKSENYIP